MTKLPNPFIILDPETESTPETDRFVIDPDRFLADVEEMPLFLRDQPPLKAYDLVSILGVLAGH